MFEDKSHLELVQNLFKTYLEKALKLAKVSNNCFLHVKNQLKLA